MFSHDKLQVYGKAVAFASTAAGLVAAWDKRQAVADHFTRASESILLNLAEAARQRAAPGRLVIVDYAIGSSLECAACLDIARIKNLTANYDWNSEKHRLSEITKMLVGLRKAWAEWVLKDEDSGYRQQETKYLFHHEGLEVYRSALDLMEWFAMRGENLSGRLSRRLDEASTSLILNIAEGNGRYAELEQLKFLRIAESALVKIAVYLDLCVGRGEMTKEAAEFAREKVRRINRMLVGMMWKGWGQGETK